jgi:ketosteroid isomerase-like protein
MTIDEKKRIAADYFKLIVDAARRQEALDLMTDDATWWAPGSATRSKADVAASFAFATKFFKSPIKVTIKSMVAEGDRVAIESEGTAEVVNGKTYRNYYHSVVIFRGDKISEIHEYCDSKYTADTLGDLLRKT